ncbi:MAG: EVE domain-containing protein [Thermomicrobiales bacterium]
MALSNLSDRNAVLQAIAEYDQLGQGKFLAKYGFGPSRTYRLTHDGRGYDIKPILAAAHGYQFPEAGPLVADKNFTSGLGTTVPKARELGFEVEGASEASEGEGSTWLFQSNPKYYDIAAAVHSLTEMNWTVAQGKNQVSEGDRLYIWQSGPSGGVIAEGHILTDPEMQPDQEGADFIRDPSKFSGEALRVRLSIDHVLGEPILRTDLLEHAVLKDLGVIRFANATNYKLKPEEDAALQELIEVSAKPLLERRVDEWRLQSGYPNERDEDRENQSRREQLAAALSRENLDDVVESPSGFEKLDFAQLAHKLYGDAGNQSSINSYLKNGGLEERSRLARTIRHLLYGGGDEVGRLNDVLENPEWKVPGFSEVLATKVLSVVFPETWIPMFRMDGDMGKLRVVRSPELGITIPADFAQKSYGEQIRWTNDVLRDRVEPLIPDDPWGQMVFLYWLRDRNDRRTANRPVWWVNQGAHYREERDGGYVWAPLTDKNGRTLGHWSSLRDVAPGDQVLSYANGRVRAVSTARGETREAPRPQELSDEWQDSGLRVDLSYSELSESIALEDIPLQWRLDQGAPFTKHGAVQQGYFYALSSEFVDRLAIQFPQLGLRASGDSEAVGEDYNEPDFDQVAAAIRGSGMSISDRTLRRYHASLRTRGFVILSGVSGTGKTWLARLYADAVGATSLVVPVAPNWTTNEDLLGFRNPLSGEFQETDFTRFLRRAAEEWQSAQAEQRTAQPFHLILDEMNLAHVEYYFAKFLSAMEVRATDGDAEIELAPGSQVLLPPNLFFIGTVNVDETTRGFADKVYDRAQLLELEIARDALATHIGDAVYATDLLAAWDAVQDIAPFAFRVADEIRIYVQEAHQLGVNWEAALDEQLLQKVMPKIKGADLRIEGSLDAILSLCDGRFPLTHEKAKVMRDGFSQHGFATYF